MPDSVPRPFLRHGGVVCSVLALIGGGLALATPVAAVAASFPTDLDRRVSERLFPLLPGDPIAPAEIAEAIAFLDSPAARMITGAVLAVDGAMS